MPSNLPILKTNTKQENIDKMKKIAKHNKRSMAKELEYIVEKHINEFETIHGKIKIDDISLSVNLTSNVPLCSSVDAVLRHVGSDSLSLRSRLIRT